MKICSATAVGVIAAMTALATGIAADMVISNSDCNCAAHKLKKCLRHKAGSAMHTLGDKLNKTANEIEKSTS
ncbi:MAG: hypothetical protein E7588_06675 [Ruminococcaceae bacterium]|nr:hypothetical protein [Oscillospiraceae bacterium]